MKKKSEIQTHSCPMELEELLRSGDRAGCKQLIPKLVKDGFYGFYFTEANWIMIFEKCSFHNF